MPVYKLKFEDFLEDDYHLIAIHTTMESYQLAFLINQTLEIMLERKKSDVDKIKGEKKSSFAVYNYKDEEYFCNWVLIENKYVIKTPSTGLFKETEDIHYLINEEKKTDCFLKIEGDLEQKYLETCVDKINKIPQVIIARILTEQKLEKYKKHLIF